MGRKVNIYATYLVSVSHNGVELEGDETPEDVVEDLEFEDGHIESVELQDWDCDE